MLLATACTFHVGASHNSGGTGAGGGPDLAMTDAPDDMARPAPDSGPPPPPVDMAHPPPPPDMARTCMGPGIIICDDYEDPKLPGYGFGQVGGTLAVDDTHVHQGKTALHLHQALSAQGSQVYALKPVTFALPEIYVRAYVYTEAAMTSTATLVRIQESKGRQLSVDLQLSPTAFTVHDGKSGLTIPTSVTIPVGRWFCMQWRLRVATDGVGTLAVDPDQKWTSQSGDSTIDPPYDWLVIGLQAGGATMGNDVWVDELAMSGAPIACDVPAPGGP